MVEGPKFDGVVISTGRFIWPLDFRRWCRCWQYFHHRRFPLWFLHWEDNRLTNRNWSDVHSFHLLSMQFHAISASTFSSKSSGLQNKSTSNFPAVCHYVTCRCDLHLLYRIEFLYGAPHGDLCFLPLLVCHFRWRFWGICSLMLYL